MLKNKVVILVMFLIFTSLIACKTQKNNNNPADVTSSLFVKMQKTPCYGSCPSYSLEIYKNGAVKFEGKSFVDNIGQFKSTISEQDIESIKAKIIEINFFNLEGTYDSPATDIPSCITHVWLNGKEKKIIDRRYGPEELKDLEKLIEEKVLKSNLIKIEE